MDDFQDFPRPFRHFRGFSRLFGVSGQLESGKTPFALLMAAKTKTMVFVFGFDFPFSAGF